MTDRFERAPKRASLVGEVRILRDSHREKPFFGLWHLPERGTQEEIVESRESIVRVSSRQLLHPIQCPSVIRMDRIAERISPIPAEGMVVVRPPDEDVLALSSSSPLGRHRKLD